jgi:hypothetical protein
MLYIAYWAVSSFFSHENAKSIAFGFIDRKEGLCTSPKEGEHHTIQLDPTKLSQGSSWRTP